MCKTDKYRMFEEGNTLYDHEIDIVRLLQYFRFMRHFTKNLMLSMSESKRSEFNRVIKGSLYRKVQARRRSEIRTIVPG